MVRNASDEDRFQNGALAHSKGSQQLNILDSPFETLFDDLVKLASHICGTPMSVITVMDDRREWFITSIGFPNVESVHRDPSIWAHSNLTHDILEIPDATQDARFAEHPFVLGDPGIRFYVAVPIMMPMGENIGTLCVIDREANYLTNDQTTSLLYLAKIVSKALTIRNINLPKLDHPSSSLDTH